MIRKSTFSLKFANQKKIDALNRFMDECLRVTNVFIDLLWEVQTPKFPNLKTETWLSARAQQNLSKQAAEVVRSQHKRKKKAKPELRRQAISLDFRFVDIRFDENSFDVWLKLSSLGGKMILKLPMQKHRHFNKFINDGWKMKEGCRLRKTDKGVFVDLYLQKSEPATRKTGKSVGFDCGYKKLLVDSEGRIHDVGLEPIYEKIARKRQKSKAFYRALDERDNAINRTINAISLENVKHIVAEDLKCVKKNSRGKIRKKFNDKLQRWSYPKVLEKLSRVCEEMGIAFTKVNPAYTSQKCSSCGHIDKRSRKGESFVCMSCGMRMDADCNAAINILHRGVFSHSAAERA